MARLLFACNLRVYLPYLTSQSYCSSLEFVRQELVYCYVTNKRHDFFFVFFFSKFSLLLVICIFKTFWGQYIVKKIFRGYNFWGKNFLMLSFTLKPETISSSWNKGYAVNFYQNLQQSYKTTFRCRNKTKNIFFCRNGTNFASKAISVIIVGIINKHYRCFIV